MSGIRTGTVTSADGTVIVFDQSGAGPAVILVQGALMNRSDPVMTGIAAGLSRWFTVFNYDRRGRGDSGDTQPYAVEREAEDLAALIAAAGGSAAVFGGSSGAGLALQAAARNPAITRLALWEPPYHVDDTAPRLPHDFAAQLDSLVRAGRRADAVELFLVRAAEASPRGRRRRCAVSRSGRPWRRRPRPWRTRPSSWARTTRFPRACSAGITQPTLVLNGGASPAWMGRAGKAVAGAIPGAVHRVLEGQAHYVAPEAIVPELLEFLITA